MRAIGRFIRTIVILAIVLAIAALAFAWSGIYDVRVGTGHTPLVNWYLETMRERAIARRAESIRVPDLSDEEIWSIVAFLQVVSDMTEDEYRQIAEPLDDEPDRDSRESDDEAAEEEPEETGDQDEIDADD